MQINPIIIIYIFILYIDQNKCSFNQWDNIEEEKSDEEENT